MCSKIPHIFNVLKVEINGKYKQQIQNNSYLCVMRMVQEVDMIKKKVHRDLNYTGQAYFLNKCGIYVLRHFFLSIFFSCIITVTILIVLFSNMRSHPVPIQNAQLKFKLLPNDSQVPQI